MARRSSSPTIASLDPPYDPVGDDHEQLDNGQYEDTVALLDRHRAGSACSPSPGAGSGPDPSERLRAHTAEHHDHSDARSIQLQPLTNSVPKDVAEAAAERYTFKHYYARALLNTLGPALVLAVYLFTVLEYFLRPAQNGVSPSRFINPKAVFFAWFLSSIFLLDWAKSGLAGFEAAALMRPRLAPRSAMQLMWHLDRGWGGLSGWWKAVTYTAAYWRRRLLEQGSETVIWDGPGLLWWYLACSSFLFYAAVPLSALSMDPRASVELGSNIVTVTGPNKTTFDFRSNPEVADLARSRWRQGLPTTPLAPAVFYAPSYSRNVSTTFYDDAIQNIYQQDMVDFPVQNRNVTFFSGPRVKERIHGRAWGLLSTVSCSPVNVYRGLKLINVTSFSEWDIPIGFLSSAQYEAYQLNGTLLTNPYDTFGVAPGTYFNDTGYGVAFQYLLASDRSIEGVMAEYANRDNLPIEGSFELAMWQSLQAGYGSNTALSNMSSNPLVVSSEGWLGYGVQCNVESSTGFANLDAASLVFSDFAIEPSNASESLALTIAKLTDYPGLLAIQSIVLAALSDIAPGYVHAPSCLPGDDATCSAFYGANLATGGNPILSSIPGLSNAYALVQPAIDPNRMTLAMYKIFGETAAAMMAIGGGDWTSNDLTGLVSISDLVPGRVPWQLVLGLLVVWFCITVLPQSFTFAEKRWSSTLEAFELFRFGAEWREAVQKFESNEFHENTVLRQLPGLIGDMEPNRKSGFVGLSRSKASPYRSYVNDRVDARK